MSHKRLEQDIEAISGFGTFLATLRASSPHRTKQKDVVEHLPGWIHSSYSRLESGELAPRFDLLPVLYQALRQAGIDFTSQTRQQFLDLARRRLSVQQTHRDEHSEEEWSQLRLTLARLDGSSPSSGESDATLPHPLLADTSHLLGRDHWREGLIHLLHQYAKKLIVLRGPAGIGKSSELNWLATQCMQQRGLLHATAVILCDLRYEERNRTPEDALDLLITSTLREVTTPQTPLVRGSREERQTALFTHLERTSHPVLLLVDHGECLMQERGRLAPCWQHFLTALLRYRHQTTLILATRQWPGWYGGEHRFVEELALPLLPREVGIRLLQQLGLEQVAESLLSEVYEAVGGIPLCLEWVAALAKQPQYLEDWAEIDPPTSVPETLTQALKRLLTEPHIFGGALAGDLAPLLERTISPQRLSPDATRLMQCLAVATLPLAKPALQVLTGMPPIKELRHASLLVAYPDRVQLLPMVAAAVLRQLTSEQVKAYEGLLLDAYRAWRRAGGFHEGEEARLIAEQATLLLQQQRFLSAAQLLIGYGWISLNAGYGARLSRLVNEELQRSQWRATPEQACGGLLLRYFLASFSDQPIDEQQRIPDHQYVLDAIYTEKITVRPEIETYITHYLMHCFIQVGKFVEGQALLELRSQRLLKHYPADKNAFIFLQEKYAMLFGKWCEYLTIQGDVEQGEKKRQQAIAIYQQCIEFLTMQSSSQAGDFKRRLAFCLTDLGYHLNRMGLYDKALQALDQSITLKEQGYTSITGLGEAYGEKSQVLVELGQFQQALYFDEQAIAEIQHAADAGHRIAQEDIWIYRVNRGRLYFRLGRVETAEQILREALSHVPSGRSIYSMFAEDALYEIEQWKQQSTKKSYQFDWRWIERYRELDAFDAYWWWAYTGPFTEEEQRQWEQLWQPMLDEETKRQLGNILVQSREREIEAALAEQREPQLLYPALDVDEVRRRIAGFLHLDEEIGTQEPNAIVRRLYHETIEEEVSFLRMIEATATGDSERFLACSQFVYPEPTQDEMREALEHVRQTIIEGLGREDTCDVAHDVSHFLQAKLHLSLETVFYEPFLHEVSLPSVPAPSLSPSQQRISAQAARRFFETVLCTYQYDGWQVVLDPQGAIRVESGLRCLFLPDAPLSLTQVSHLLTHELAGHVARSMAGERSQLGLLAIGTKHYAAAEEGIALYSERQIAFQHGQSVDNTGLWQATLAVGLARGVMTPPQTFLALSTFLEKFFLLIRLLKRWDKNRQIAQRRAKKGAIEYCLRTFRGVPDLTVAGVCATRDAVYLRGLRLLEQAVQQDETILDRLMIGKTALEYLPVLQELGMVSEPQRIRELVSRPDLETYILSFEEKPEESANS